MANCCRDALQPDHRALGKSPEGFFFDPDSIGNALSGDGADYNGILSLRFCLLKSTDGLGIGSSRSFWTEASGFEVAPAATLLIIPNIDIPRPHGGQTKDVYTSPLERRRWTVLCNSAFIRRGDDD